jgi:predicted transcriptional regulator
MTAMARREQARDDEDLDAAAVDPWGDNLSPEEEAELEASIARGLEQLDAGRGIPHEAVMQRLRDRRRAAAGAR